MAQRTLRDARLYWMLVAAFLVIASVIFFSRPPILVSLRYLAFDSYQTFSPAPPLADSPVRVVAIDERSLQEVGQWPWPRSTIAQLTEQLGAAGSAAIVFDVLFAEPDRTSPEQMLAWLPPERSSALRRVISNWETHDSELAATLARYPTVLATVLHNEAAGSELPVKAGFAAAGDDPAPFLPAFDSASGSLPILTDAAMGVGFINWLPDRDQVLRRVPLLARQGDVIAPSLDLETLRVAQRASTYIVRSSNAHGATAFGEHTGVNEVRVGGAVIPTDQAGDIWVHFRRSNPTAYISAADVLSGAANLDQFNGRIVLIGATAPGLMDLRATPLDAAIPGVEIHQQVLEQVVASRYLNRPDFAPGIEWVAAIAAVLLIAFVGPRLQPSVNAIVGIGIVALSLASGAMLFTTWGYLFDPVFPAICAFLFSAGSATYFYRRAELQRAEIRRAFSQYVAPSIVKELTTHPERLKLGGEVRDITLLVCDIRNFTTVAEKMNAVELTAFINSFLTPLTDLIIEGGGTIDKYMGDSIMAFWNAPLEDPEHARRACEVALRMSDKLRELNAKWRQEAEASGRPFEDVAIGIGLNSGECCVGNLGSDRHFDYSAIGDPVNVTARLESLTKVYGLTLLVGEETVKRNTDRPFVEVDLVRLKGRKTPSRVFTLLANGDTLAPEHQRFLETYRQAKWDHARALLAGLRESCSSRLAALYATYDDRIERLSAATPADWDGVYELEQK